SAPIWLRAGDASALSPGVRGTGGRKLVVLLMQGGNDGLNTVVPFASSAYYARRPPLAQRPDAVLKLAGEGVGLHPSLKTVHDLYGRGQVAIVQGVGYDDPNLSHFESMDVWQTGSPQQRFSTGWLGRWLDSTPDE